MNDEIAAAPADPSEAHREPLTWTVRLYERAPAKRYVVLGAAVAAGALGLIAFRNPIFGLLGFVAILASTAEFWLPLRYRLDQKSASVRCGFSVTAIEWANVRRVIEWEEGFRLSPHRSEGRTSPFRGVILRCEGLTESVRTYVKNHINSDARFVGIGIDGGGGGSPARQGGEGDSAAEVGDPGDPGARVS